MSLTLDPATEARIQRELEAGNYAEPSELLAHALDLVEAERAGLHQTDAQMEDWLLRNTEAINAALEESFAARERGEGYSPEQSKALLAENRDSRKTRAA